MSETSPTSYVISYLPYPDMQPDMYSHALVSAWYADDALAQFKDYFEGKGYVPATIAAVPRFEYDIAAVKEVSVDTTVRYYV